MTFYRHLVRIFCFKVPDIGERVPDYASDRRNAHAIAYLSSAFQIQRIPDQMSVVLA